MSIERKKTNKDKSEKDKDFTVIDVETFLIPAAIFISGIMISLSIVFGFRNLNSTSISKDDSETVSGESDNVDDSGGTDAPTPAAAPVPSPSVPSDITSTNIDDDPILGDKNKAKIAIVEFSDYECPFCKRHYEETVGQLKSEYIDTGKAIMVFRDYPLDFHDPLASQEAMAAECVQELGGDGKYYEYHDLIFETTSSNGNGMPKSKLYDLASKVGVDEGKFKNCLDSEKYMDEVQKDITDGQEAGISGSPGFIIGKLGKDGSIEDGVLIKGAYPFSEFKSVIDGFLSE